jgi:hypothetical protein
MTCEYQNNGYSTNINKQFLENPNGYYQYFKEILEKDMSGVRYRKRLYVIKHYIMFSYLTKHKLNIKIVKNPENSLLIIFLWNIGKIRTKKWYKANSNLIK